MVLFLLFGLDKYTEISYNFSVLVKKGGDFLRKKLDNIINDFSVRYIDECFDTLMAYEKIIFIGEQNNGYITIKDITKNNISREYIRILKNKGAIVQVDRGIYILKGTVPDDFYIFQTRYPKTIFSHFTALYFYNITEEFPYYFDVTCDRNYNVKSIKTNNIFYVEKSLVNLGIIQIKTKYGNIVNAYDIERTICDVIRNDNRLDYEQVVKCLKKVFSSNDIKVDMHKLTDYSKKLKCYDKVMRVIKYYE